jgi:sulfite exporter TauE/SafE
MTISVVGAIILGLLGSLHCAGMCGPLAAGACGGCLRTPWNRIVLFVLAKGGTYAALGALCGGAHRALSQLWAAPEMQMGIGIACGAAMIALGVIGLLRQRGLAGSPQSIRPIAVVRRTRVSELARTVSLGAMAGILPCGLTYAMLAHAASASTPWNGAVIMIAFGTGTAPALLLAGWLIRIQARWWIRILSCYGILLLGGYTVLRGLLGYLLSSDPSCCHGS